MSFLYFLFLILAAILGSFIGLLLFLIFGSDSDHHRH